MRMYNLVWVQLDAFGAVLLLLGLSLFLVPLSLTGSGNSDDWHKGSFIAMLVMGVVILVAFIAWDTWFAKKPFVPYRMIRNRTVAAACCLGALDFFHYSVFSVFFPSYLQVAGHYGAGPATRIEYVPPLTLSTNSPLMKPPATPSASPSKSPESSPPTS
jgi:MFS family permease